MTCRDTGFGKHIAAHYEAWYETPEGRRADELEKELLRWLLQGFPQGGSVLEIGCGTGHFTRWLHRLGLATVGLDLSAVMLTKAKRSNGVPLVQGNALHLPFADGAIDVTAFITTLEFLESPGQALVEAVRVARRGVVLGVLNRWSPLGLRRRLAGLSRPDLYDAAHFYGVEELRQLLRSVGGRKAQIVWRTTLFPRAWAWAQMRVPWGGFIGMAMILSPPMRTVKTR